MPHKVALDFGTTNTVVARWAAETGDAVLLELPGLSSPALPERPALIPSLVYVRNGRQPEQNVCGQQVRDGGLDLRPDNRLFRNFKRGLVTERESAARFIDEQFWSEQDASQHFIFSLLAALPFGTEEVEQLVLTAPVAAFESYLHWLNQVVGPFGDKIRIVDESTAAALGYAVTEPGAVVLIFDFGGGTLDLSLVQLPQSRLGTGGFLRRLLGRTTGRHTARVIAKAGQVMGGSDIDQWLLSHILAQIGLDAGQLGSDYTRLLTQCEQVKIALSTAEKRALNFSIQEQHYNLTLTRATLENLLTEKGFYSALRGMIDRVMHFARRQGIFKEDIHAVLMVGGTSLMPSVQAVLSRYFEAAMIQAHKPFTAVAEGALQVAAGLGLDDYLIHSYALRYFEPETDSCQYDEIIPGGSRYPTGSPVEVRLSAAYPGQTEMEFIIGEIVADAVSMVQVVYEEGQAVFVAQANEEQEQIVPLNRAEAEQFTVTLDPPGQPEIDRINLSFDVDARRHLRLTAVDLHTGETLLTETLTGALAGSGSGPTPSEPAQNGRAPLLSATRPKGQRRLTLRRLSALLPTISPDALSLEAAAELLHSDDFYVRYSAAELLSRRADRDARLLLQEVLADANPAVRASAARHLYYFSWFAAEPLLRQALADADYRVRECALYALCQLRTPEAFQLILTALPHEGDEARSAVAWGLTPCRQKEAVPVLTLAVQATEPGIRVKALEALGTTQAEEAVPIVEHCWQTDPDPDVLYAATLSLIELVGEACFEKVAAAIGRGDSAARYQLLRAFFHATSYLHLDISQAPAVDAILDGLAAAMTDNEAEVRQRAVFPLAWIRHPRAAAILQQAYDQETDSRTKAHIIDVTVSFDAEAGEGLLALGLASPDPLVRETAVQIQKSV